MIDGVTSSSFGSVGCGSNVDVCPFRVHLLYGCRSAATTEPVIEFSINKSVAATVCACGYAMAECSAGTLYSYVEAQWARPDHGPSGP